MPRHRVTAKGNNIPERVETFEELRDRYHIPPQLMANLTRYGYEYPTGIQSAGCPILLQVSRLFCFEAILGLRAAVPRLGCNISYRHRKNAVLPSANHVPP
jgi:hypothetical protein